MDETIALSILHDYGGLAFVAEQTLHLSRELEGHPNLPRLIFWARQENLELKWHDQVDFVACYSSLANPTKVGDNEIQRYVVALLEEAYKRKASDIHIINTGHYTAIKLRILGLLKAYDQKSADFGDHMLAMLYNYFAQQTGAAVFNRLQRLDGRIINPKVLPTGVYAIRLHSEPIQSEARDAGTFMTLRLLYDSSTASGDLDERLTNLGFLPAQVSDIVTMCRRGGLAIISGATGHGKSTVLKHIFEAMVEKTPERAYFSVEDPPEYRIQGVNQIQVQTQNTEEIFATRSRNYQEAIAGAMRSDPDILMIGEIRYAAAAEAAINAALTGHGVWATLHAADAFACVLRLENLLAELGLPNPLDSICDSNVLQGLTYQRLLPTLCPECKIRLATLPQEEQEQILGQALYARLTSLAKDRLNNVCIKGSGCAACQDGNLALTVCAETVLLDQTLLEYLRKRQNRKARLLWKARGGLTSVDVAVEKILQGQIDPRDAETRLGQPLTASQNFYADLERVEQEEAKVG